MENLKTLISACRKMCTLGANTTFTISEVFEKRPLGSTITIRGWIAAVRKYKEVAFINVVDGSCSKSLQVVSPRYYNKNKQQILMGASVDITGELQLNKLEQIELQTDKLNIIHHFPLSQYPLSSDHNLSYDYCRQFLHLRPQIERYLSILLFRNAATQAIHQYFTENNFIGIHTPIITSNDCEGAGEIFTVQANSQENLEAMKKKTISLTSAFFDIPAYLTVSGQLHLECAARGITKTYTFNPCFRAENTKSRLHLSEFYMVEAEEAFITDLDTLIKRIENFFKCITSKLLEKNFLDLKKCLNSEDSSSKEHFDLLHSLINKPFKIMTFTEAKSMIEKNMSPDMSPQNSPYSMTKAEELLLVQLNEQIPVFVIDWPKKGKPFYMKTCKNNEELVKKVDLIIPNVGEVCGGSLREDDHNTLENRLKELNIINNLKWYLELRKYRNVPTAGFGMGFERYLQFVLNLQNIRDTIPFPRWPHGLHL